MAYSSSPVLNLNNLCFSPETGTTLCEKLADCYRQLSESTLIKGLSKDSIIKQTVFISALSNPEYYQSKQKLFACAKLFFDELPPTSIIAQLPDNGSLVLEIAYIEGLKPNELIRKQNENSLWLVFHRRDMKIIFAAGLSKSSEEGNIMQQSLDAFNLLHDILVIEEMEFSDIIRQWNYIEQITGNVDQNHSLSQHYQIFNDVRSRYYQLASFDHGFPAATGIGMEYGGISIDIIAAKSENRNSILGLKSPVQLDAYAYSKEVLAENNTMRDFCRTTPKFERAKILITPENKWIFISGTAAIAGQVSIPELNAEQQTEMTIQNIMSLISPENLLKHGANPGETASINHLRVYVKYKNDMQQVKNICLRHFPNLPIAFAVADICRPELLVEIEGQAVIN